MDLSKGSENTKSIQHQIPSSVHNVNLKHGSCKDENLANYDIFTEVTTTLT